MPAREHRTLKNLHPLLFLSLSCHFLNFLVYAHESTRLYFGINVFYVAHHKFLKLKTPAGGSNVNNNKPAQTINQWPLVAFIISATSQIPRPSSPLAFNTR